MDAAQTLGKYEIRGTLGKGAMGTVYDGWDPAIARRVAIKTVNLPADPDPDTAEEIARFRREAQAAGRLTHPNIVAVYDYGETADVAYIVTAATATIQQGWTWRHVSLAWPRDRRLGSLLLVPVGMLLYVGYLWWHFGQTLLFLSAERHHWGRRLDWPFVDVWRRFHDTVHAVSYLAASHSHLFAALRPDHFAASLVAMNLFPLAALIFAIVAIALGWRRLPPAHTAYAVVAAAFPLFFPTPGIAMFSYHRFLLMAFPLFMAMAVVTSKHAVLRWSLLTVSFVCMLWLTCHFAVDANAV